MDADDELAQLRARVAHLEALVERLAADGGAHDEAPRAPTSPAGLDRRRMLRNGLGLSAIAVAGVGVTDALGSTAAASTGDAVTVGQSVAPSQASDPPTRIYNADSQQLSPLLLHVDNTNPGVPGADVPTDLTIAVAGRTAGLSPLGSTKVGVYGISEFGLGVRGDCSNGVGVLGHTLVGGPGVKGTSDQDCGVWGEVDNADMAGVLGVNKSGSAVEGLSQTGTGAAGTSDSGTGVVAASNSGPGLHATSQQGPAVVAECTTGGPAVLATADDRAVVAQSRIGPTIGVTNTGDGSGIEVHSTGSGVGVAGVTVSMEHQGSAVSGSLVSRHNDRPAGYFSTNGSGYGVESVSLRGVGASFAGQSAAIRLYPQKKPGHPTRGAHLQGELLIDIDGRLWLCTRGGTPGHWRQLAFV